MEATTQQKMEIVLKISQNLYYLIAVFCSLLTLASGYLNSNILLHIAVILSLFFHLYLGIRNQSFRFLKLMFDNYFEFNKLRQLQGIKKNKKNKISNRNSEIKNQFQINYQEVHSIKLKNTNYSSDFFSQKFFSSKDKQAQNAKPKRISLNNDEFSNRRNRLKTMSYAQLEQIQDQQYQKSYNQFKKTIQKVGLKEKQKIKKLMIKIKEQYVKYVEIILVKSDNNLKNIIQTAEKYFLIKVVEQKEESSFIDKMEMTMQEQQQKIDRKQLLEDIYKIIQRNIQKYSWRNSQDLDKNFVKDKLKRLIQERVKIDNFFVSKIQYFLTWKQRVTIIEKLKQTFKIEFQSFIKNNQKDYQQNQLGDPILKIVRSIYNQTIQNLKYDRKFMLYESFEAQNHEQCFTVARKIVAGQPHYDLLHRTKNKVQRYGCTPGQNNIWSLLLCCIKIKENQSVKK